MIIDSLFSLGTGSFHVFGEQTVQIAAAAFQLPVRVLRDLSGIEEDAAFPGFLQNLSADVVEGQDPGIGGFFVAWHPKKP